MDTRATPMGCYGNGTISFSVTGLVTLRVGE
jgi:hypothetical protein